MRWIIALILFPLVASAQTLCTATGGQAIAGFYCPDQSGNSYSNAFEGGTYTTRQAGAVSFVGTADTERILFNNAATAAGNLNVNKTLASWVFLRATNAQYLFHTSSSSTASNELIGAAINATGNFRLFARGQTTNQIDVNAGNAALSVWTHVAITWNATSHVGTLFVNGTAVIAGTNVLASGGAFVRGTMGGLYRGDGPLQLRANENLDDFIITTNVEDIATLYTRTTPATYVDNWHTLYSAVAVYRFECWSAVLSAPNRKSIQFQSAQQIEGANW